ncbi:MAG: PilW family protein [Nitrospiraceae bacterium]
MNVQSTKYAASAAEYLCRQRTTQSESPAGPRRSLWPGRAGMSLIELLIAMTAAAAVLSTSIQAITHFEQRWRVQQETMAQQQDLRIGLQVFEEELRAAGSGAPFWESAVVVAQPQEIQFRANLSGRITTLTAPVSPTQLSILVEDGAGWPGGKRLWVCDAERCAESRLARRGRRQMIAMTEPLGQAFPEGSVATVSNDVRYYLRTGETGDASIMRQVDGGANPLIGGVDTFRLSYVDRHGVPTEDAACVARVRILLAVSDSRRVIIREVGLRTTQ